MDTGEADPMRWHRPSSRAPRSSGPGLQFVLPMQGTWYRRGEIELGDWQFAVQDPDGYLLRFLQSLGSRPVRSVVVRIEFAWLEEIYSSSIMP